MCLKSLQISTMVADLPFQQWPDQLSPIWGASGKLQKAESLSRKSIKRAQEGLKHKLVAIFPTELDRFSFSDIEGIPYNSILALVDGRFDKYCNQNHTSPQNIGLGENADWLIFFCIWSKIVGAVILTFCQILVRPCFTWSTTALLVVFMLPPLFTSRML